MLFRSTTIQENNQHSNLRVITSKLETSDLVSYQFASLGVNKINVVKSGNIYNIDYTKGNKGFYINKDLVDISQYKFIFDENAGKLSIANEPDYTLVDNDLEHYINSPSRRIDLGKPFDENDNTELSKQETLLMMVNKDLSTGIIDKITLGTYIQQSSNSGDPKPCGFFDTYTVVSLGLTRRSSQLSHNNATTGPGALGAGCRRMTPPETSCLYDNHACATTSTFCCDK